MGVLGPVALPPHCRTTKDSEAGLGEQEGPLYSLCARGLLLSSSAFQSPLFLSTCQALVSPYSLSEMQLCYVADKSLWCQVHPGTRRVKAHLSHDERPLLRDLYEGKLHPFPAWGTEGQGPALRVGASVTAVCWRGLTVPGTL